MKYLLFFLLMFSGNVLANEITFPNGDVFFVKLAKSDDELKKGLMHVTFLPQNEGMLFDLRKYQEQPLYMWMKDTPIALDMIFFNCDFEVVDIYENARPYSLEYIGSSSPFCYVLEINGGEVQKHQLKVGDKAFLKES